MLLLHTFCSDAPSQDTCSQIDPNIELATMSDDKKQWAALAPKPGAGKNISQNKLQAFTIGMQKKTPFQKHKEEVEQKKKKESEEAAKVYAEFVASFENENGSGKAFVRGETIVPKTVFDHENANREVPSSVATKKALYKPMAFVKPVPVQKVEEPKEEEPDEDEEKFKRDEKEKAAKKKRNLDSFLEEIKREQEEREDRLRQKHAKLAGAGVSTGALRCEQCDGDDAGPGSMTLKAVPVLAAFETFDKPGSHDTGDTTTTNLYVGNINPLAQFAKYGPIASVKIMWPRTQEEKDRNRNCGFVSFMERKHAEQALRNLDGKELLGYVMRVGAEGRSTPATEWIAIQRASGAPQIRWCTSAWRCECNSILTSEVEAVDVWFTKLTAMYMIQPPQMFEDYQTTGGKRVIRYGPMFEALIMDREWNNPKFKFLFENEVRFVKVELLFWDLDYLSPEHVYYRWKLYSILQGDRKNHWQTDPFQMFDEGPWWIPPDIPFDEEGIDEMVNSEEEDEREREHVPKGILGKKAKQRLEIMLRRINFQRGTVAKAMAFAIDHADAADEVVDILTRALMLPDTPVTTKIARLYLVSDILHNSSVPVSNAWKYRSGYYGGVDEMSLLQSHRLINIYEEKFFLITDPCDRHVLPSPSPLCARLATFTIYRFEGRLPDIFEHLNQIFRSITARLKAEQFRLTVYEFSPWYLSDSQRQVTNILTVWENWIVFPQHYIEALSKTFMKRGDGSQDDGTSGEDVERQDGDVDVEPMEYDGDDVPMDTEEENGRYNQQVLPVKTKWDVDDEDNGAVTKDSEKAVGEIDDMFA
ncbi:hypothetical protein BC937DRAFT_92780 [Endogone sp. FLAS-F59071]|nr:hypothetical protein BC937DRAFT_92780 [Endogone sp. FLAS-F59071]|eukprot:RUS15187.1 hypothetical protein BC937DRAFT_92780 [Endogone sp. FLAS-F59071]